MHPSKSLAFLCSVFVLSMLALSACVSPRSDITSINAVFYEHVPNAGAGPASCVYNAQDPGNQHEIERKNVSWLVVDNTGVSTRSERSAAIDFATPPTLPLWVQVSTLRPADDIPGYTMNSPLTFRVNTPSDLPVRVMLFKFGDATCLDTFLAQIDAKIAIEREMYRRSNRQSTLLTALFVSAVAAMLLGLAAVFLLFGNALWRYVERNIKRDMAAGVFGNNRRNRGAFVLSGIALTGDPANPVARTRAWDRSRILAGSIFLIIGAPLLSLALTEIQNAI
jgi:hypothetical protein